MSESNENHIGGEYTWDGEYKLSNDPWFWALVYFVILMVGAILN